MGRRRPGQQRLYAWLSGLDETRLMMVIETLTAILNIANGDDFFEEGSHDASSKPRTSPSLAEKGTRPGGG